MIEVHEYRGLWWLPQSDEEKLAGTLLISKGSARLELIGSFGGSDSPFGGLEPVPRILGVSTGGKAITLEGCMPTRRTGNLDGIPATTVRASAVLVGAWFEEGEEVMFDEVAFRTSDLDTWATVSGFTHGLTGKEEEDTGHLIPTRFEYKFTPPPAIDIPLRDGYSASLRFHFQQTGVAPVTTTLEVTQTAWLNVGFPEPRSLDEAGNTIGQLRNFLSLAVGRPLAVLSITGYQDDLLVPGHKHRLPIEVLYEIPNNPEPPQRALHPAEMLFTLPETKPSLSEALQAWLSRQDVLRPVFSLYFGSLYHPTLFLDQRFVAYAQAIETYDRRRRDATDLPPEDHERRIESILASTPAEHINWLKEKLRHSNALVLGKRLRDVIGECPEVSTRIFGSSRQRSSAIRQIVDTRNYYTHYDPRLEKPAAKGAALYLRTVQLRAVIEMSLLRELGFGCDDIIGILERVQRLREIEHFTSLVTEESDTAKSDQRRRRK